MLSYEGSNVLMPRGSRLIGIYSSDVSIAQRRALIAWTRLVTPDGRSVELGGVGGDAIGRSGQTGHVNTHFGARFGSAALISLIGAGPQLLVSETTDGDTVQIVGDVGKDLQNASRGVVGDYLRIKPAINIGARRAHDDLRQPGPGVLTTPTPRVGQRAIPKAIGATCARCSPPTTSTRSWSIPMAPYGSNTLIASTCSEPTSCSPRRRSASSAPTFAGETSNPLGPKRPIVSGRVMSFGQSLRVQIIVPPAIEAGVSLSIRK